MDKIHFGGRKEFVYGNRLLEDLTCLFFHCLGANKVTDTVLCKEALLPNASMLTEEYKVRVFSGGPAVETLHFQCQGYGFKVWWEN